MAKKPIKIYLEENVLDRLKGKASFQGFEGKGALAKYLEIIANNDLILIDGNFKTIKKLMSKE